MKPGQLPPARKRPRKLLGGGTTRCKPPKGKGKAIDGYSSPSTQDNAGSTTPTVVVPDGDVADVRSVDVKMGVGPKSGRGASLKRKSAPAVRSVTAAGVSNQESGVVGAGVSGVDTTVNPAVKAKKVRYMRGSGEVGVCFRLRRSGSMYKNLKRDNFSSSFCDAWWV